MNASAGQASESCDLDGLLAAISEAMEALVSWNIVEFQLAIDRQRAICEHAGQGRDFANTPDAVAKAQRIRELIPMYERLLIHSQRWTRTIQSIVRTRDNPTGARASLHLRA